MVDWLLHRAKSCPPTLWPALLVQGIWPIIAVRTRVVTACSRGLILTYILQRILANAGVLRRMLCGLFLWTRKEVFCVEIQLAVSLYPSLHNPGKEGLYGFVCCIHWVALAHPQALLN